MSLDKSCSVVFLDVLCDMRVCLALVVCVCVCVCVCVRRHERGCGHRRG